MLPEISTTAAVPAEAAGSRTAPARRSRALLWALIAYAVLAGTLLPFYYHLNFKDEVNYIAVAERFARGDLLTAPNAYWSPGLPLLLAPLIAAGVPAILGARLVQLAVGLFALAAIHTLARRFDLRDRTLTLVLVVAVPITAAYSLSIFTPDLLLVGILALYFSIVLSPSYAARPGGAVACGALGAALFLAKGFGLVFFPLHFTLASLGHWFAHPAGSSRRLVVGKFAAGLAVFLSVVIVWGWMLHRKYQDPDVGAGINGPYNHAIHSPALHNQGTPSVRAGFVPPADDYAVSIWEEPYYHFKRLPRWSALESKSNFLHYLSVAQESTANIWTFLSQFSVFWAAIVAASLVAVVGGLVPRETRLLHGFVLGSAAVYTAPYAALYSEIRYMWPLGILFLVLGSWWVDRLQDTRWAIRRGVRPLIAGLFALSFLLHPAWELMRRLNDGRDLHAMAQQLEARGLRGARIASNWDFGASVVVAYQLRARYYGHPPRWVPFDRAMTEMLQHPIDYFLVWESAPVEHPALQQIDDLRAGSRHVRLYAVRLPQGDGSGR